jgi:LPS-assembly lipoprotein
MSLSNRRTVLFTLAAAALAGGGFAPVSGPGGSAETMRGSIRVAAPGERNGFLLVAELEQRLGRGEAARYTLDHVLALRTESNGIATDASVTRYTVTGTLDYTLTNIETGAILTSGQVDGFTNYSGTTGGQAFAAAQQDATERLIVILADRLVTRLSLLGL